MYFSFILAVELVIIVNYNLVAYVVVVQYEHFQFFFFSDSNKTIKVHFYFNLLLFFLENLRGSNDEQGHLDWDRKKISNLQGRASNGVLSFVIYTGRFDQRQTESSSGNSLHSSNE